jgi:ribosomal protein L11 methyltransferase
MSYVALRFDIGAEEADVWSDALLAAGALSVDACDSRAGTSAETPIYAEPGEHHEALWPITQLTALFDAANDPNAALQRAAAHLERSPPPHEAFAVPERDWVLATRMQFEPIQIEDRFWIVPSWCTAPDPSALNLSLDPGLAFGTGSHPTTKLCLMWLRMHVAAGAGGPVSVLDYGCGSGILAIAASKLGAKRVVGTDVDPQALLASAENARSNAVVGAGFVAPDEIGDETFDIVVANILTNALVRLAPRLASHVREGGRIALCGILASQAEAVADSYRRWFAMSTWRSIDGWSLFAGVRRQSGTTR